MTSKRLYNFMWHRVGGEFDWRGDQLLAHNLELMNQNYTKGILVTHHGYIGLAIYDDACGVWYGKIDYAEDFTPMKDLVTFESCDALFLSMDFAEAVDDWIKIRYSIFLSQIN